MEIFASQSIVNGGQTISLTASVDDPDGDVIAYAWTATGGTLADDDAEATSWTAPAATDASVAYVITLTITDDQGGTGTDTITITVRAIAVPRTPQRALRTLVEIDLPGGALSLRFSERNFMVGNTFYEARLLAVPSITWTLGSILQPHLEIPEIPLHFSDAPSLIAEGRNLGNLIRSHDFFSAATIVIRSGEIGGAFTRVFRGHVLEGSIRIEDHSVSLQVEAEANIATAVPLPALEGGAWNLIYDLRQFQSQHAIGRWFLDTQKQIRTVTSVPYFEVYTVLANPVHFVPERDGMTDHGVDYWVQPTTGSRLVDRTRDHTFTSTTTGFLRIRRPRVDTAGVPINASEFRLAEERADGTIVLHAFTEFSEDFDRAGSSLGSVSYDARLTVITTDRMLWSTTELTFPAGSQLRYQWRPPETAGTFHVVDLARNFMAKAGVTNADIDTDAFDALKVDLTDAGAGSLSWLTRGVYNNEEAGLDQVARVLADAFCDLGLTQAGLLRPVRRNLIPPANPALIEELNFLPRQIGGRDWILYVDPERLQDYEGFSAVRLRLRFAGLPAEPRVNRRLTVSCRTHLSPPPAKSPFVFAGAEVALLRAQWHLDRFAGNILVLQGSVQINDALDVGDIIRVHLPVLGQDGALFQIRELTRDLVDDTHHFVALGGKVQT